MNTFHLTMATPDGNVFSGEAVQLRVRGVEGELAVLAGHTPFVTPLKPCDCVLLLPDDTRRTGRLEGGLLTVARNAATVLSASFRWIDC